MPKAGVGEPLHMLLAPGVSRVMRWPFWGREGGWGQGSALGVEQVAAVGRGGILQNVWKVMKTGRGGEKPRARR